MIAGRSWLGHDHQWRTSRCIGDVHYSVELLSSVIEDRSNREHRSVTDVVYPLVLVGV